MIIIIIAPKKEDNISSVLDYCFIIQSYESVTIFSNNRTHTSFHNFFTIFLIDIISSSIFFITAINNETMPTPKSIPPSTSRG